MENKEKLLLGGEIATRSQIKDVNALLILAAQELLSRAIVHGSSKLEAEEHEKFSLAAARFKGPLPRRSYGNEPF